MSLPQFLADLFGGVPCDPLALLPHARERLLLQQQQASVAQLQQQQQQWAQLAQQMALGQQQSSMAFGLAQDSQTAMALRGAVVVRPAPAPLPRRSLWRRVQSWLGILATCPRCSQLARRYVARFCWKCGQEL